ncbi:MAG: methyltransferase domain-containing protein [Bacteroidia bacterium]|nr:methyltransferase domain-containing protein [Bacteroidia bacterium]
MRGLLSLGLLSSLAWSWGFWAHRRINRMAVFALPETLFAFYRLHIDHVTRQATKPDERRMAFIWEPPRHYIDLDRYPPRLPRLWREAVALLSEDTLNVHGILPWHLEQAFWELVEAFRYQDAPRILRLSAEIGHYLGDAHVPLHTTANYNGQLTDQHGVHALWESLIPEQYGESYDYWVGPARLWHSVQDTLWTIVYESHNLVESVLSAERHATHRVGEERKYTYRLRGKQTIRSYSEVFLRTYHTLLEGMVEQRLRLAIHRLSSLWLTAWHLAGRPSLPSQIIAPEDDLAPDSVYLDPRCGESTSFHPHRRKLSEDSDGFSLGEGASADNVYSPLMMEWFSSPYYRLLYAHRDDKEAEGFVETLMSFLKLPAGANALDAGCGEGRYARALHKKGLSVDAVDIAVTHPHLPKEVRFFHADLRTWSPSHSYHLIGSFFTSLSIGMERWEEVRELVSRFAKWLLPQGWLVIDYLNIYQRNPLSREERLIQEHLFYIERWQDNLHLYKRITIRPLDKEGPPHTFEERILKLTQGDLYQIIQRAGLLPITTWGDYEGHPFHPTHSPRLIVLAQKPVS